MRILHSYPTVTSPCMLGQVMSCGRPANGREPACTAKVMVAQNPSSCVGSCLPLPELFSRLHQPTAWQRGCFAGLPCPGPDTTRRSYLADTWAWCPRPHRQANKTRPLKTVTQPLISFTCACRGHWCSREGAASQAWQPQEATACGHDWARGQRPQTQQVSVGHAPQA